MVAARVQRKTADGRVTQRSELRALDNRSAPGYYVFFLGPNAIWK